MNLLRQVTTATLLALMSTGATAAEQLSLDEAIQSTLQNNFSYRIARLEPQISSEAVTRQEAAFDTELFVSAQVAQSEQTTTFSDITGTSSDNRNWQAGARKRTAYGTSLTAQTNLDRRDSNAGVNTSSLSQSSDISLSLRQPLLSGFGKAANTAALERARAGLAGANESYRDALQRILAETELAYWSVASWQEQLELDKSNLQVAETLLEEARERERVGMVTQVEVLQAEAAKAQRMEEIISSKRNLGDAFDQLLSYMGVLPQDSSTEPTHQVELLDSTQNPLPEFQTIWELALKQDPTLAAQETVIEEQEWTERAARNAVRPSLDLVLSGAYTGVDDEKAETAYENAFNRDGHAWAIGLEFSMPWSLRAEKAELKIANKRLEQETIRYNELKQSLYRQVRAAWRDLHAVQQGLEAARLTVNLQQAAFERETSKYEEGLSVFRDVLEGQSDLDQARIRLLRAKFNKLAAEIEMARLSGTLLERHNIPAAAFSQN